MTYAFLLLLDGTRTGNNIRVILHVIFPLYFCKDGRLSCSDPPFLYLEQNIKKSGGDTYADDISIFAIAKDNILTVQNYQRKILSSY